MIKESKASPLNHCKGPHMHHHATAYHRTPIRLINSALRGLNKIGLAKTPLDQEAVMAAARKATGLSEFGDDRFLEPMQVLIQSLEQEADLNPLGRILTRMNLVRILKHRLYVEDLLKRHPEILERRIPDPVVVIGPARSGTTRLHRLLAADDRFLHLKSWESINPVPYPESFTARDSGHPETDPRITGIKQALKAVLYMAPQMAAVHPLGTFEVEEEIGLIQHSFASQLFEVQAHTPTFSEWLMTHDQKHAYEYMLVLMKIIAWFRNDPEDKPWVLKTPQYMQDLDGLLHIFPNAKLICSHRDPIKVVGSVSSLTWSAIVRDSDSVKPNWIGPEWLNKMERMLKKTIAIREQVPADNQYDIQYADITSDWQQAMQGIFKFLGMPFTDHAKADMQSWMDENSQHKHGAHTYSLEDFGLNKEEVDQRLMFYRDRYNIPYETKNLHT